MLRHKFYVYGDENVQVPYHLNFGKEMLDKMMEYGAHPALINADDGEIMTYAELAQKTADIALSFSRIGVRKGDVVSICSEKRMEVMPTILGVMCVGGVYAPIENTPLLHRLRLSKPKVMFLSPLAFDSHKPLLDSVGTIEKYIVYGNLNKDGCVSFEEFLTVTADLADFIPTPVEGWKDIIIQLFSSGTTGLPKAVPWTHLGLLLNSYSCIHDRYKKSSILITREWYLTYGIFITLACLRKGLTCVFSVRSVEEDYLRAIEKYNIKIIQSAPTAINQMIKSAILNKYDVTSVEALLSSSMPVGKEMVQSIMKRLPNLRGVYQIYGTTEAGGVCNEMHAPFGPREGSCGTPSHGFIMKVVDFDTRESLGAFQRGEVCFKSPCLTPGYIGMENNEYLDSEGYFKTGDVGYYDNEGYFYIINRVKDLIKYRDYSIAPAELEAILCENGQVREAGVTSVNGEISALVVLQPGATASAQELENYLNSKAPSRMRLEGGVYFVSQLPRGAGDKLDRHAMQQALANIVRTNTSS